MTKLIVTFCNSSNALNLVIKNYKKELIKAMVNLTYLVVIVQVSVERKDS